MSCAPPPGQYRKPVDVAAELGVTVRTVRAWMAAGKLPSVLLSPRARRIRQGDLERFLAERRQGGATLG
jgi:excisionase family DNA binding protein